MTGRRRLQLALEATRMVRGFRRRWRIRRQIARLTWRLHHD